MSDAKKSDSRYALHEVFPDAVALFSAAPSTVDEVIATCDVVLDTNVLLLPYRAGSEGLGAIAGVFARLAKENRLFVPGQVVREFVRNRASQLGNVSKHISDRMSKLEFKPMDFPLLDGLAPYKEMQEAEEKLREATLNYKKVLGRLHADVLGWGVDDPVYAKFREILAKTCVFDPTFDFAKVREELDYRFANKIPPGYGDASKDDGGIGDLIIWKTVLQLGTERQRDLAFVSGEEKSDWQYRGDGRGIAPRAELIDEYRRLSEGRSFYLIQLSQLLRLRGAKDDVVEGVRAEEIRLRDFQLGQVFRNEPPTYHMECPYCGSAVSWRIKGITAAPQCSVCGQRFHAHRTDDSVAVRKRFARHEGADEKMRAWFFERYTDPANGVPHDSEDGYIYTNGGPYDPWDVLHEQFGGTYPPRLIDQVAEAVAQDGHEWVKIEDY